MNRALSVGIYGLSSLIGLGVFFYPFFLPVGQTQSAETPLLTAILLIMCLIALLIEMQGQAMSAKVIAALGVLIAITSVLRFLEVAIPGPGGFSPIFVPIILAGFVFGGRFGFLMGALTMLVSGLITGGIGPWLPYQMFAAGWVGLGAGWLPKVANSRAQLLILAAYGFAIGIIFGILLNLYFWPFAVGDSASSWQNGLSAGKLIQRYAVFYMVSSFFWDLFRAVGNVVFILVLGAPLLRIFERFKHRFDFEWVA